MEQAPYFADGWKRRGQARSALGHHKEALEVPTCSHALYVLNFIALLTSAQSTAFTHVTFPIFNQIRMATLTQQEPASAIQLVGLVARRRYSIT